MNLRPENAERVNAYTDGQLSAAERAALERELAGDPALAGEIALQGLIDRELEAMFPCPAMTPQQVELLTPKPIRIASRRAWWAGLAAAAVLTLVGLGVWLGVFGGGGHKTGRMARLFGPDTVYERMESRSFTPEFVCKDNTEFRAAVEKRLGSPLELADAADLKVLGWAYTAEFPGKVIGDKTMIMMTKVGDAYPIVLMDRAADDRTLELKAGSKLHLFRRQVGPIVAYEVTPLDQPRVVDLLREPAP